MHGIMTPYKFVCSQLHSWSPTHSLTMSAQAYSMQSDMCVMYCTLNSHNDRITIILTTSPQVIVIP